MIYFRFILLYVNYPNVLGSNDINGYCGHSNTVSCDRYTLYVTPNHVSEGMLHLIVMIYFFLIGEKPSGSRKPSESDEPNLESNSNASQQPIEIIEKKIQKLDLDRYTLNLFRGIKDSPKSYVKVIDDSMKIKNTETRFRRVSLSDGEYDVGWVVSGDVNCCMDCGAFFVFSSKHHCRACGNIVCEDCSPYQADVPSLNEEGGSRICRKCFHGLLKEQFVELKRYGSFDIKPDRSKALGSPKSGRKVLVTVVPEKTDLNNKQTESRSRTDTDNVSSHPRDNYDGDAPVAQFYISTDGKAAQYLFAKSNDESKANQTKNVVKINENRSDDEHITVSVAPNGLKSWLFEPRNSDSQLSIGSLNSDY